MVLPHATNSSPKLNKLGSAAPQAQVQSQVRIVQLSYPAENIFSNSHRLLDVTEMIENEERVAQKNQKPHCMY